MISSDLLTVQCVCAGSVAGDSEHKPYICGDADHSIFPLDGSEDYLILACDGFWDTVSPDEAVRVVSDHLSENTGDTTMVAHKLVASARDAGSSDNITVMVVFLRDPRCPAPASFEEEEEGVVEGSAEQVEESGGGELEEEEEEEEPGRLERGGEGGTSADQGVKSRSGWPLQQCSAPADLAYEDRTDSFTDRTSLSLMGPLLVGRIPLPRGPLITASLQRRPLIPSQEMSVMAPLFLPTAVLLGHCPRQNRRPGSARKRLRRALGRYKEQLGFSAHVLPDLQLCPGATVPQLPFDATI